MLSILTVLKWQADSWKRVRTPATGQAFLLNTNRLDSIIEKDGDCTLYYFDNPFDERDRGDYMVIDCSLADLITVIDTAPSHLSMTLSIFPDNDHTQTPVDTEISIEDLAYAYQDTHDGTHSWVVYSTGGWDLKKVLVNQTGGALLTQVL